ncbi:MAG TPA: pilus assembly protein TadG-related protein [Gammaproteobacteria bacterium]
MAAARRSWRSQQRGQAIVFMLLSAGIVVLLGLLLLNTGILTSEKMQLQNAADAAVYSVSTVEARDLNFTAYTNRAMIANEVAIGQLVGLMSWAAHFSTVGPFMNLYFNPILSALEAGTLGIASFFTVPMRVLIQVLTSVGATIRSGVQALTTPVVPVVAAINKVYSIAQRSFHLVSFLFSVFALDEMLKQNADDAELSGFGLIALAAHFVTYYGDLPPFDRSFVTSYRQDTSGFPPQAGPGPTTPEQKAGMERLASIINASRDPFSINRYDPVSPFSRGDAGGWSFPLFPPYPLGPIDFTAELDLDPFDDCPGATLCIFSLSFYFQIAMERSGGTDLRYVTSGDNQFYNWSAADTTGMVAHIGFELYLFGTEIFSVRIDGGPPLAIGAAQAGRATGPRRAVVGSPSPTPDPSMLPVTGLGGTPLGGEVELDMYGGSPINSIPWMWVGPIPAMGPSQAANTYNIGRGYPGLPRYNDTKPGPDPIDITTGTLGFEAPYLMIGLIKEADNIGRSRAKGRFSLNGEHASDAIGVISKSEVYFSRPNDLSYFRRADAKIEYGSGFNPYWQARLVDTTYLDRLAALAIQQQQLYLPSLPLGPVIDDIDNLLDLLP